MIKRISSLTLTLVVLTTFFSTRTFATTSGDELKPAEDRSASRKAAEVRNEKLREAFNKLVADAKAGREAPAPRTPDAACTEQQSFKGDQDRDCCRRCRCSSRNNR
jgi:hypothetical protein